MPLTQDRMIEVLEEAQEAREYALSLHDNIGRILEIENSFMALAALRELYDHLAVPSMTRCVVEREHFAKRARANEANARRTARARAKRRGALHGDDHDNVNDATARKDGK